MKFKHLVFMLVSCLLISTVHASADGIDSSKAITIGSGAKSVFEFTDPDCPFCRKASTYFEGRRDVTRHIFFYPLPRHLKAKDKAQYILSKDERERGTAYRDVMSGRMDSVQTFATTPRGVKLQQEQFEIAKKMKINSTPTFIINGRIIVGFDLKKIEEALGPKP